VRIRTVKPEFWRSDDIDALSIPDRLLFIGLWSYVDDSGVGVDKESAIAADLFAGDLARDPHECSVRVHGGLQRLAQAGLIRRYTVRGRRYIHIVNWAKHQKINRPTPSKYPPPTSEDASAPGELMEDSVSPPANSPVGTGEQGNRGTGDTPDFVGGVRGDVQLMVVPDLDASSAPPPPPPPPPPASTAASASRGSSRGSRIPDDFAPSPAMLAWAAEHVPMIDIGYETEKFRDYWSGRSGAAASKRDWPGTWRNWMRKASEDHAARRGRGAGPGRSVKDERVMATLQMGGPQAVELFASAWGQPLPDPRRLPAARRQQLGPA
jgi:hypothetical protein